MSPSQANALAHGSGISIMLPQSVAAPFTAPSLSINNVDGILIVMQSAFVETDTLTGKLQSAVVAGGPWVDVVGGTFANVTGPTVFGFQAIKIDLADVRKFLRYIADGNAVATVSVAAVAVRKFA